MKTAAVICEYNPFHNGHKYQIDKAHEILGQDTCIIAIMSGNFTQRGEIAVCDKYIRAKAAVLSGANLVLELPFPYSMSSAEFFAKSGVHIINKLGVVDHLIFGCECESVNDLYEYVQNTEEEVFKTHLSKLTEDPAFADYGYPKLFEKAYRDIYKFNGTFELSSPNNVLAIEYLRALKRTSSKITPLAITRKGAGYNDALNDRTSLQSASAIRSAVISGDNSALKYIPITAKAVFEEAIESKKMPADPEVLSSAVISHFRLNPPTVSLDIHDAFGGLYNRLYNNSFEANSISSLTVLTETKKYTKARVRRALWNSFFGVTSSDIRSLPTFTQILAFDSFGRSILKRIPKTTDFHIFTKPSDTDGLSDEIIKQKKLSDRADSVYGLCLPKPLSGHYSLKMTPFVKK